LEPELKVAYLLDFTSQEEKQIMKIAEENRDFIINKWNEYFK